MTTVGELLWGWILAESRRTNVLRNELRFRSFLFMKLEQRASKAEHTNIN